MSECTVPCAGLMSKMYSHSAPNVPGIGSGSIATLTRIKQCLIYRLVLKNVHCKQYWGLKIISHYWHVCRCALFGCCSDSFPQRNSKLYTTCVIINPSICQSVWRTVDDLQAQSTMTLMHWNGSINRHQNTKT